MTDRHGRVRQALVCALGLTPMLVAPSHAGTSAHALMRRGDFAAAVPVLRRSLERAPSSASLQRDLGIALVKSGDARGALAPLRKASTVLSKDPAAWYYLATAAEATGDSDLALSAYRFCQGLGRESV